MKAQSEDVFRRRAAIGLRLSCVDCTFIPRAIVTDPAPPVNTFLGPGPFFFLTPRRPTVHHSPPQPAGGPNAPAPDPQDPPAASRRFLPVLPHRAGLYAPNAPRPDVSPVPAALGDSTASSRPRIRLGGLLWAAWTLLADFGTLQPVRRYSYSGRLNATPSPERTAPLPRVHPGPVSPKHPQRMGG